MASHLGNLQYVAPLVGAWIEIFIPSVLVMGLFVAPLVGAWIEIFAISRAFCSLNVAPLVGAWIEMVFVKIAFADSLRRSSRGSVD